MQQASMCNSYFPWIFILFNYLSAITQHQKLMLSFVIARVLSFVISLNVFFLSNQIKIDILGKNRSIPVKNNSLSLIMPSAEPQEDIMHQM